MNAITDRGQLYPIAPDDVAHEFSDALVLGHMIIPPPVFDED